MEAGPVTEPDVDVRRCVVKTNYLTYFRVSRGAATYDDSQLPFNLDSN